MITHKEFLSNWLGKRYQESASLWFQCVSLIKLYCEEVYGIKWLLFGGSAINGWNWKGNLDTYFDRVDFPHQWDIIFFNATLSNQYWHVVVQNDYDTILEQNWWNWNGNWLWTNAIRLWKAPANAAGFMRPKFKPMPNVILRQHWNPDCSLAATMNCAKLNNPHLDRLFTQELLDKFMPDYENKTCRAAFKFLKEKGYEIKFMPLTFEKAKIMMKKWRAVVGWLQYTQGWVLDMADDRVVNGSKDTSIMTRWHAFALKMVWDKYFLYDSNFDKPYEIDIDKMVNDKIVWKSFYQIR